ncbi:5'/3'-nucleotidase SurE [Halobacteriales archaeon QS_4_69_34]|nr:MAG: 5'/3'-nucleotidase SurE [Halobacteriales archaeon QS_4_69_34]
MDVLLTNDDGIESTGIRVLAEALSTFADVTVVAPADDRSAVGRSRSREVTVEEHDLGYAVSGTPTDCVICGLCALVPDADLVVAGCNEGANLGEYVLGRSGTVSAAVEATFFAVPAIAVSLYIPGSEVDFLEYAARESEYEHAVRAAAYLAEGAPSRGVFEHADYLNVNAPIPENGADRGANARNGRSSSGDADSDGGGGATMEVTRPSHVYDMDAVRDGESIELRDCIWGRMADGDVPDPEGTDRRAVLEGRVSVSPLTAPHTTEHHESLDELAAAYGRPGR